MQKELERAYQYWMICIPGMGRKSYQKLLDKGITPKELYFMQKENIEKLLKEKIISHSLYKEVILAKAQNVEEEYQNMVNSGIRFVVLGEENYPQKLRCIPDSPLALYYYNSLPKEENYSVAIIGARNCSEYGKYVAEELGKTLAKENITVISGLARGIDGMSQMSAAKNGGSVYAVLGCGVDVCYPKSNEALYEMLKKGENQGIISEYPPGTLAKPHLFPPRNRIISGLSDAVVVIEAKQESGTLITVDMALEQGKEIYALPGRVTDRLSDGCNRLIKDGALVFLSPKEFVEDLKEGGRIRAGDSLDQRKTMSIKSSYNKEGMNIIHQRIPLMEPSEPKGLLSDKEKEIYKALDIVPQSVEKLLSKVPNLTLEELLQQLMMLQAKGVVSCVGNAYRREI